MLYLIKLRLGDSFERLAYGALHVLWFLGLGSFSHQIFLMLLKKELKLRNSFCLNMSKNVWLNSQQPKTKRHVEQHIPDFDINEQTASNAFYSVLFHHYKVSSTTSPMPSTWKTENLSNEAKNKLYQDINSNVLLY